jgi:hypothetical protein
MDRAERRDFGRGRKSKGDRRGSCYTGLLHFVTVDGGGLDQIDGGTGADTFAFSHDGAANAATVHGFNVANDTIELSHSLFTKLTAGATPTFSISAVSQSATDHLGYNATAGVLWYNSNGSAAAGWVEIARLAAGLKLTAANFSVV